MVPKNGVELGVGLGTINVTSFRNGNTIPTSVINVYYVQSLKESSDKCKNRK